MLTIRAGAETPNDLVRCLLTFGTLHLVDSRWSTPASNQSKQTTLLIAERLSTRRIADHLLGLGRGDTTFAPATQRVAHFFFRLPSLRRVIASRARLPVVPLCPLCSD